MTLQEKLIKADDNGNRHLAAFNELNERGLGESKKAQEHLRKGQYWLDRYNKLAGNS